MDRDSPHFDPLDREIAAKMAAIAEKERALEMERIELRALQHAAELRPVIRISGVGRLSADAIVLSRPIPKEEGRQVTRARGRVPGTLSRQWRQILGHAVKGGNAFLSAEGWALLAMDGGFDIKVKSARDWLRRAAAGDHQYVERRGDTYRVAPVAIEKFGLQTAEPSLEVPRDGPV